MKTSALGSYDGYTEPRFDAWQRESRHLAVRDGTRLAVDILRPSSGGHVTDSALPAIWTHTRYQRADVRTDGSIRTLVDRWDPWLDTVIKHGYVVLVVDVRGGGASFGVYEGQYAANESRDAYDVTEWIAEQPWCDGNVGMFGRSYLGITQYFAASQAPPHLKAIFPEMASFDHYDYAYSGGIYRDSSRFMWQLLVGNLDQSVPMIWLGDYQGPVAPVDEDADGELLAAALREHRENHDWYQMIRALPFRDSIDAASGEAIHTTRSAAHYRAAIAASGVAIYHLAGWYDMFPCDTLKWWCNLDNPQKVVIGPWFHSDAGGLDFSAEHLRWYDYWLKSIDNGVMREDPIHYYTLDVPESSRWRSTAQWPLPQQRLTAHYFSSSPAPAPANGPSGQGMLSLDAPLAGNDNQERYTLDYTTSSGPTSRWANANGGPGIYPDMAPNDEKCLTYTTSALEHPVEITGHPVVHLWLSTAADDIAVFVLLEDVDPEGRSHYVTEGMLRASNRALGEPDWNNIGLPHHPGTEASQQPLPDEPVELVFDLHPTSKHFRAGHRIRIAIAGSDIDNWRLPIVLPAPTITVHRDATRPSRIILPVIPC